MAIPEGVVGPSSPVFKLSDARLYPGADLQLLQQGLRIVTSTTAGSFAVQIPGDVGAVTNLADRCPVIMVLISAKMLSGKVGIGCIATDGSTYLAEAELEAPSAGSQAEPIAFLIETPTELGSLVIRNAAPEGEASSVTLESVEVVIPDDGSAHGVSVSLEDARLCGGELNSEGPGLSLVTPEAIWSYAVQIPVRKGGLAAKDGAGALVIVSATFAACSGRIGFGALAADGNSFLDESEVDAAALGDMPVQVRLLIDDLNALALLVVRNRQPHNQPSAAVLRSVNMYVIDIPATLSTKAAFALPPKLRPVRDWPQYYGNRADTLVQKLRLRAYRALAEPMTIPWLDSLRVWLYPRTQISGAVAASGLYEPGMLMTLKEFLPRGGVFLDVGANIGLLSLFAARVVGPDGAVHAFEPSPREYGRLRDNVVLNGLDRIIHAFPLALGANAERRTLRIAEDLYSGLNTFGERYFSDDVETRDLAEVSVQTLDRHIAETGLRRVDVLKVDTEGFETFVFQGGRDTLARWHPVLLLEVSPTLLTGAGSSVPELETLLRAERYRFYALDEGTGERWPVDALAGSPTGNVLAVHSETQV